MPNDVLFYRARDLVGTQRSRKTGERGLLPFSPASLWRLVREGEFPRPVKLSEGVTAWPAKAVHEWMQSRGTP